MRPQTKTGGNATVSCGKILLRIFFRSLKCTKAEIIQTGNQKEKRKKEKHLKTKLKDTEEPETGEQAETTPREPQARSHRNSSMSSWPGPSMLLQAFTTSPSSRPATLSPSPPHLCSTAGLGPLSTDLPAWGLPPAAEMVGQGLLSGPRRGKSGLSEKAVSGQCLRQQRG